MKYLNHRAIGLGIKDAMARGVPREEIFVTTKLFPSFFGYDKAKSTVPKFLEELDLDYVDLVLMHGPGAMPPLIQSSCTRNGTSPSDCRKETWTALSELREQGIMRNVGVSDFAVKHTEDLAGLGAPIANNQFQFNPMVPDTQHRAYEYCQRNNITVTAYYSLAGTFEKSKTETLELFNRLKAKYGGRSVSQILLRWAIQMKAAVIPGTGNPDHMRENLDVYNFEISPEDMDALNELKHEEEVAKQLSFLINPMDAD